MTERWRIDEAAAGERVDRHVAARSGEARNQVQHWLEEGRVQVDGRPVRASHRLRAGETVTFEPPPPAVDDRIEPEEQPIEIVFEDRDLVVVNKPAGLVVHPGAGRRSGTLVHRLLARYPEMAGVGGPGRPGIVHRLDKDTTGLLIAARNRPAHRRLADAFAGRRVEKRYLAVAWGPPIAEPLVIDRPVGRHPTRRREMTVRPDGRPALTGLSTVLDGGPVCLLDVLLGTGRTHQIRVHLKAIGHPLVGDPIYGEERFKAVRGPARRPLAEFARPALHAWRLALAHPRTGEPLRLEAPVPGDLVALWLAIAGEDPRPLLAARGSHPSRLRAARRDSYGDGSATRRPAGR